MPRILSQKLLITVMLITGPGVSSAQGLNLKSILDNTKEKAQQARDKIQDCSENFFEGVQSKVENMQESLQARHQLPQSNNIKLLMGLRT